MENVVDLFFLNNFLIGFEVSDIKLVVFTLEGCVLFNEVSSNNLWMAKILDQGLCQRSSNLTSAPGNKNFFLWLKAWIKSEN